MSSEWQTVSIASLCTGIYDGPHATPKKTDHGPIFLGISSLNKGQLDLSSLEYLSEEDYPKWTKRVVPKKGDVVFSYETRLGEVAIIPEGLRCCLGRRMALMRIDESKAIPEYILYAYLSSAFQKVIHERTIHGSTVDRIPLTEFGSFPISIPPLCVQKEIAETLKSLDNRITLLRETNTTLEAITQALFKSWFVDFDPVRAKQAGREPEGMDADTAALFPNCFEESELGLVPMGWRVGSILEVANLISGGTPKTDRSEYWGGEIQWASAKDVSQSSDSFLVETERTITQQGLKESATKIIPIFSTVIVARGATTGRMVLFGNSIAMNQTCYALETKSGNPFTLYCKLRQDIGNLVNAAHGSIFDTITTSTFSESKTVHPPNCILKDFEDLTEHLFQKILIGVRSLRLLTTLRDTLLPRLISGQLRLPDAEALFEEATA